MQRVKVSGQLQGVVSYDVHCYLQASPSAAATDDTANARQLDDGPAASQGGIFSTAKQPDTSSARQRGKAFMSKALANTTQGLKAFAASRASGGPAKQPYTQTFFSPDPLAEGSSEAGTSRLSTGEHEDSNSAAQVQDRTQTREHKASESTIEPLSSRSLSDRQASTQIAKRKDSKSTAGSVVSHDLVHQSVSRQESGQELAMDSAWQAQQAEQTQHAQQAGQAQHAQQARASSTRSTTALNLSQPSSNTQELAAQDQSQQHLQPMRQYQKQISGNPFAQATETSIDTDAGMPPSPFAAMPTAADQASLSQAPSQSPPQSGQALFNGAPPGELLSSRHSPKEALSGQALSSQSASEATPSDQRPVAHALPGADPSSQTPFSQGPPDDALPENATAGQAPSDPSLSDQADFGQVATNIMTMKEPTASPGTASSLANMLGSLHHAGESTGLPSTSHGHVVFQELLQQFPRNYTNIKHSQSDCFPIEADLLLLSTLLICMQQCRDTSGVG